MATKNYKLARPSPLQEYYDILSEHKEWRGMMDKELVTLVLKGKAKRGDVEKFIFARKVRKYA